MAVATTVTIPQARALAQQAGWSGQDITIAVAVALAESSLDPNATGPFGERGLWQVYPGAHPDLAARYDLLGHLSWS